MVSRRCARRAALSALLAALAALAACGDDEFVEPRGPVRRMVAELPLEIVEPGTYALARDLDGQPGEGGIVIRCDDVVLDLGGHTLFGGLASGTGVTVAAGCTGVSVRDGALKAWGRDGLDATAAPGVRVEGLEASLNGGAGLRAGDGAVVTACLAGFNWGGRGIEVGADAVLTDCLAHDNALGGIWAGPRAELRGCTARRSTYGAAFRAGDGSLLEDCTSEDNLREGFLVGADCELLGCRAVRDVSVGISAGAGARLDACESVGVLDGDGIRAGPRSTLAASRALDNAGRGVVAGEGSVTADVESRGNRGDP